MSATALLPNIRNARSNEFDAIAKMQASALANSDIYKTLYGNVDPLVAQQWLWNDVISTAVAKGHNSVLVIERTDTSEILGVAWIVRFSKENRPVVPSGWAPEGFNREEQLKLMVPKVAWQNELLEKYGQYYCEFRPSLGIPSFISR
jgi:hypothetical protein